MNQALRDDLQALAVSDEGLLADAVLRGRNGDVNAHLALLEVRCPQLAEKAVKEPGGSLWTIALPDASVDALRDLLLYLYTDGLPPSFSENPTRVLDLLTVAASLVSRGSPHAVSESRNKRIRLEDSPCEMRRLWTLCEQYMCESMTEQTVVEVLQAALRIGSQSLEDGVYKFLKERGSGLIKSVPFNQSLVTALSNEHPEAIARAISAAAGTAVQVLPSNASQLTAVPPSKLLQHLGALFESSRDADGTPLDLDSRIDCRICWGELVTSQLAAHRCVLAARSAYFARMLSAPMRESSSGKVPITLPVGPSSAAVKAFLWYLYMGSFPEEVDGQPLTTCDWVDVLSIADGPGGCNFLQLSDKAHSEVRELAMASLAAQQQGDGSMMFLRRSMAQKCVHAQPLAFNAALQTCAAEHHDLKSFKACFHMAAKEEWWTPAMEQELLVELLWRRCATPTESQSKTETKAQLLARRRIEYDFVSKNDTRRSEEYFLICTHWLDSWKAFIRGRNPWMMPPGPISNNRLMDAFGNPLPDKQEIRDYRGLNRAVWEYLHSRYGGGPEIKRNRLNLYKPDSLTVFATR
ncbi:USP20 [Symbiodinium sp. CCMP2592]|nr:USP20 [Symbiodinium sp. CCMP2592]